MNTEENRFREKVVGVVKSVDEAISRIYVNISIKSQSEYLKIYTKDEAGKNVKFFAFKTNKNNNSNFVDYEYYDSKVKKVILKVKRIIQNGKERLIVDFFDNLGNFTKGFTALKVMNKATELYPDYVAFSKTLRLRERA